MIVYIILAAAAIAVRIPTDDDANTGDMPIDALVEPSNGVFEFSVPGQSRTSSFAVWIRYRIKIFDSEGNLFANWPKRTLH